MVDWLQNIIGLLILIVIAVWICNKIYTKREKDKVERDLIYDEVNTKSIELLREAEELAQEGIFKEFEELENYIFKNLKMLIVCYYDDYKGIGFGELNNFEDIYESIPEEILTIQKLLKSLIIELFTTKHKKRASRITGDRTYTLLHIDYV